MAGSYNVSATTTEGTTAVFALTNLPAFTFTGFQLPGNGSRAFKLGSTVPIKFQLTVNGLPAPLSSVSIVITGPGGYSLTIVGGTGSGSLRFDATANQFVANWQTKGLAAGTYSVTLFYNGGNTGLSAALVLATTGGSAALVVDGASTTSSAGALLAGELTVFVDNSAGFFTSDEVARINDAIAQVDGVVSPYGTDLIEVDGSVGTAANIVVDSSTATGLGGVAQGVLGATTDAGEVTIVQGWNWYGGADTTQIASNQYDFETVVTHELGHAIGLGHSTNSASVMFATLNTGITNRALAVADLNVPDTGIGVACGLHATPTQSVDFSSASASVLGMPSGAPERVSLSADSRQAGLNAVLADWPSASDFSEKSSHLLNDTHSLLSRLSQPTIDDQGAFWSSIGGATVLDRITDLAGHLGR
jgi:hypothetical protein